MMCQEDKLRLLIQRALINETVDLHAPTATDGSNDYSSTSDVKSRKTIVGGHFDSNDKFISDSIAGYMWRDFKTSIAMAAKRAGDISSEEYNNLADNGVLHDYGARNIEDKVSQLSKWKVTKFLGRGAHKIAMLLSNGHVLSISSGEETDSPGYEIMKKAEDRLWGGKATTGDLGVFDTGKITSNGHYWYAEMSQIIPLNMYVNIFSGKESKVEWHAVDGIRENIVPIVQWIVEEKPNIDADKMIRIFKSRGTARRKLPHWLINIQDVVSGVSVLIGSELTWGWIAAIIHAAINYGPDVIRDAHFENVGVNIADPSKLILFDIA